MADPRDEMLREMAKHRGFRLVRSRRRKPGGDFGRYGLTDLRTGQDCFGIGRNGLEATAEEIEGYLRRGAKADWKRSLGAAGKAAKAAKAKVSLRGRVEAEPPPPRKPEPEPEPELVVRDANTADAGAIAALLGTSEAEVAPLLRQLIEGGEAPLVAEQVGVLGCAAWHVVPSLRRGAVGRITTLAVAERERRRGVGTTLAQAVEARLADRGCALVEAVSDIDRANAHGFLRRLGYQRTSDRFAKPTTSN